MYTLVFSESRGKAQAGSGHGQSGPGSLLLLEGRPSANLVAEAGAISIEARPKEMGEVLVGNQPGYDCLAGSPREDGTTVVGTP